MGETDTEQENKYCRATLVVAQIARGRPGRAVLVALVINIMAGLLQNLQSPFHILLFDQ